MSVPIYIFCLHGCRTGGPEALHQLSDALIAQGFDARLVYYAKDDISRASLTEDKRLVEYWGVPDELPDYACPFEEYAHYKAVRVRSLTDRGVVVIPETMAHMAPLFAGHNVVVWWLSVDNGLHALSKAAELSLNTLRAPHIVHAAQSRYAANFIDALQFRFIGMLSDYTTDLSKYAAPLPWAERPKLAAFNMKRVTANLPAILDELGALDPEIECVPIRNLSRPEVAEILSRARVYVDLGAFPGKDRGPREAIQMGAVPLVFAVGAALETGGIGFISNPAAAIRDAVNTEREALRLPDEKAIFFAEVKSVFAQFL